MSGVLTKVLDGLLCALFVLTLKPLLRCAASWISPRMRYAFGSGGKPCAAHLRKELHANIEDL